MHHRRFAVPVITCLLAALLFLLPGCGEPEPIKVGFVGELSGRRSEIGVAVRNAILLKVDEVNQAGGIDGRPIELLVHDNQGDTERCKHILEGMIEDGVHFIVGPLLSQMAEATVEAVKGRNVLVVTPTMSTDYLTGRDDNIVRTASTTARQGVQLANHAKSRGIKRVSAVYDLSNQKYTELLYMAFSEKAKSMGIMTPQVLTIDRTKHPKMLPLAERIAAAGTDAVLTCLSAVDAANLAQQLRKIGSEQALLGVSWSQTDDLLLHGGRAVEDMVLIATRNYGVETTELQTFRKAYSKRYKETPSFVAAKGYDGMTMLVLGLQNAGELTPDAVKRAILANGFHGTEGWRELDEFGDVLTGYYLVTVKDGQYVNAD